MRPRESKYPLGRFILQELKHSGLALPAFVRSIGYKNITKGIRSLDECLKDGCPDVTLLDRIRVYAKDQEHFDQVLAETRQILDAENERDALLEEETERASFSPYIQADVENEKFSSVVLFGITGGHERQIVRFNIDFMALDQSHQFELIKKAIKNHYMKNNGKTLFQGRICGYRYFKTYESDPLYFNVEGNYLGEADEPDLSSEPELFIGKRRFQGSFY